MATYGRWNRTITDGAGNIINATVYVYKESDGLLATIYSDRTGTAKANPFTLVGADQGLAFFHAVGGAYKIVATYGSFTQTWRYEPVGTASEADVSSFFAHGQVTTLATDRTALKAIDTTQDVVAYLRESGREGTFIFQSGDYSALVTADTQEGIYIKANAIASSSGAWVRRYQGAMRASWFGCVADGATDNFTTLKAAVAMAAGGVLEFGAGTFLVTIPSAADYVTPGAKTRLSGAGMLATTLKFSCASYAGISMFQLVNADFAANDLTVQLVTTLGSFNAGGVTAFGVSSDRLAFDRVRVFGSNTEGLVIGGTATNTDTVRATFTSSALSGSPITVSYTVGTGNTTAQMATGLASAINANGTLSGAGIVATASGSFVSIVQPSTLSPQAIIAGSVTGAATETVSYRASQVEIAFTCGSTGASDVTFTDCVIDSVMWSFLKSNANTGANRRWKIKGGKIDNVQAGAINLNSPNGVWDDVLIQGVSIGRVSPTEVDGFPIALSRVTNFRIADCGMTGTYNNNVIHLEEGCSGGAIVGNVAVFNTSKSWGAGWNGSGILIQDNNVSGTYRGCDSIEIAGNSLLNTSSNTSGYGVGIVTTSVASERISIGANNLRGFSTPMQVPTANNLISSTLHYDGSVVSLHGSREKLTANRTYYVRADGSDSNTGLANTAGGAFLTIQKAIDIAAATLDLAGYTVTVQVADGTYTSSVTVRPMVGQPGASGLVVQGNSGTPANVVISTTSNACFIVEGCQVTIKDMKLQTTTSGDCILISAGGVVRYTNLNFGACAGNHLEVLRGGYALCTGNYAISGGAARHWLAALRGVIECAGRTLTISGTPAFSTTFAEANAGDIQAYSNTYTGSATGARYSAQMDGTIQTFGAGASALPGNSAGSTATGGQYA